MGKHTELKSDPTFNVFAPPNVNLKKCFAEVESYIYIFSKVQNMEVYWLQRASSDH